MLFDICEKFTVLEAKVPVSYAKYVSDLSNEKIISNVTCPLFIPNFLNPNYYYSKKMKSRLNYFYLKMSVVF